MPGGGAGASGLMCQADGTAHAGSAKAAVAPWVLGEVLLVVIFGVVERAGLGDFGCDLSMPGLREHLLVGIPRGLRGETLGLVLPEDHRAVLAADIVSLAHALGRVVPLPEQLEHVLEARGLSIEGDEHNLRVAGLRGADLLVSGVGRETARIPNRGGVDAGRFPEQALSAPEE